MKKSKTMLPLDIKRRWQRSKLKLSPEGYGVIDLETGELHELSDLAERLHWRHSVVLPHEPRMPPHEYIVEAGLADDARRFCKMIEFIIDNHPQKYSAYFRGYQYPMRYLDVGTAPSDYRYWRTRLNRTWFMNRCRLNSVEPPRRVDCGAKAIPLSEWGAKYRWWPRGAGWGEWKRGADGTWVFYPESPLEKRPTLFDSKDGGEGRK